MTLVERLKAAWRFFGQWAEAVDFDPVEDLQRRVSELESSNVRAGDQPPPTAFELNTTNAPER
jgi:hypothetical protein